MVIAAITIFAALVLSAAIFGQRLPGGDMLGGSFYQIIAVITGIFASAAIMSPTLYMMAANGDEKKKRYSDALKKYKKAADSKRLPPDMLIYCAYFCLREGDAESCEKYLDEAEKKKLTDKQKTSLDTNRALLYWKRGDIDRGIKTLAAAWKRSENAVTAGSLGALLLIKAKETGDYSLALEFSRSAYQKYEYNITALSNLAEAAAGAGRLEEAEALYSELMEMKPESPSPYCGYANTLRALGREEEAKEMASMALRRRFTYLTPTDRAEVEKFIR